MRICVIEMPIPVLNPRASSPIGINVDAYADSFTKLGHEVVVVCGVSTGMKPAKKNYDIVAIPTQTHATTPGKFIEELFFSLRVVRCLLNLQKSGLDLIINMNYSSTFIASMMRFNKQLLSRIVVIHAGIEPKKSLLFGTIAVMIKRFSFPYVRLVVAPSQSVREKMTSLYRLDSGRIKVLSASGVNTEVFQPLDSSIARQKIGLKGDATLLLCVGNIEVRKNQLRLTRAYRDILTNHPDSLLVLIGLTLEEDYLSKIHEFIANSGISSNVMIIGYLRNVSELVSYYNASDLFVLVSLAEGGVPRAALEAMSCGLPCILSKIPDISEGISTEALLVDPLSQEEISHRLDSLISDEQLRARLGSEARIASMRYDWRRLSQQLLELAKSPCPVSR